MTSEGTASAIATPSGYEALLAIDPSVLEAIPIAAYLCAADGVIVRFNRRATELWGRTPKTGDTDARFCGSFRLHHPDGTFLPHASTPMAAALRTGRPQTDKEVVIERPDGSRIVASVHIDPLKDNHAACRAPSTASMTSRSASGPRNPSRGAWRSRLRCSRSPTGCIVLRRSRTSTIRP